MNYSLRPYQADLSTRVLNSLAKHKKVMAQLPTGGGKTIIFNDIIKRCHNKKYGTLVVAHRKELITQAYTKLQNGYGIDSGIIMAGFNPRYDYRNQIASIQTLARRQKPTDIKLVIFDEAHHCTAETYRKIIAHYSDAYILGVTATPVRRNGVGFQDLFNKLECGPSIKELEKLGFIVPAKSYINPIDESYFKNIRITGGDYNNKQLAEMMNNNELTADLLLNKTKFAKGLQTLVFAVNVNHSQSIANMYNANGIKAVHVDGKSKDRDKIIQAFNNKEFEVLVNVGIATEGTDIPCIECVQLVRPTKSLALFLQMVGRGCRLLEGKKNYVLLDHANCVMEHGMPNQDRNWTLKGKKYKKALPKQFKLKLKGEERIIDLSTIPKGLKGVELIPLVNEMRVQEFIKNYNFAKSRNWKPAFAWYKYLEFMQKKVGRYPNVQELTYVARKLQYSDRWVHYKLEEFKKKPIT